MSVLFSLPEDDIPQIQQQMKAGVALPVTALDRAGVKPLATGALQTIDNQIDTTTGTFKLRAIYANDDESLFPNQFVNTQLLVDTLKNVVVAPTSAIQRGEVGAFVYTIGDDSLSHVTKVTLGTQDGAVVQVESGLSGGERVVIDGADRLREGAKVSVPAPGAPSAPPAAAGGGGRRAGGKPGGTSGAAVVAPAAKQ
jgi:multidrug efflux system membrane fusion protein